MLQFLGYVPFSSGRAFPDRLRACRKILGFSQAHLAKALGVDESTVACWETGRHRPTQKFLEILKRFFPSLHISEIVITQIASS